MTTTAQCRPSELIWCQLSTLCEEISRLKSAEESELFCTSPQSPTASMKKHSALGNICWCCSFRLLHKLQGDAASPSKKGRKKTALRIIYRFIMTFWIYLCILVSFSFYSLTLQKHTIVSVNIFFCICAFASFDLLLTVSPTAFPFFLDYGGFASCQKLSISFDLISSCPICSIQPSLFLCVEFNILICLWMQNDKSRKCQSHIFWKMGPILSLWRSTLTESRGPGECLPVDKNALALQHNAPQPCTLQSPTNSS